MSYRPVTLFTGQWADMPLDTLAEKAVAWGYDGLELACAGDHFEVDRAATEDGYLREKCEELLARDLDAWSISQHLVGQALSDRIDERHEEVLPEHVWGDGDPAEATQRAIDEVRRTAAAASAFGVDVVTGFTGSPVWHLLYAFPPTPQSMIDEGYQQFADQWTPILDVFADEDVQFALEVHPLRLRSTSARPSARSTPLTAPLDLQL